MTDETTATLQHIRGAMNELEHALPNLDAKVHQRVVQDFTYALEELADLLQASPNVSAAHGLVSTACRLARLYGRSVATENHPEGRAIIDRLHHGWGVATATPRPASGEQL